MLDFSNMGSDINNTNDGITSQNICVESVDTFCTSPVSTYIHTKANIEIMGKEAITAPANEFLLAISETSAIKTADRITLIM